MRTLVTGAAGFIGSHIVSTLVEAGEDVVLTVRPGSDLWRLKRPLATLRIAELDLCDVGRLTQILKKEQPDRAIHLAWYARPSDYVASRANLKALTMTVAFAEQVFAAGCRHLIVAGSCSEYAPSDHPHVETDPVGPESIYGACKHAAHLACSGLAHEYEAKMAWARIFYLHGPREAAGRIIPKVAEALRSNRPIDLTHGNQVRDFLHVSDVAAALLALARAEATGTYNISSGVPITLRELLLGVADIVGGHHLLRFGAQRLQPEERLYVVGSPARLKGIGWTPTLQSLQESLAYLAAPTASGSP